MGGEVGIWEGRGGRELGEGEVWSWKEMGVRELRGEGKKRAWFEKWNEKYKD